MTQPWHDGAPARDAPPPGTPRRLSPEQLTAIHTVMQLFVEDDLAAGIPPTRRLFCHACRRLRPMAGFIRYDADDLCNACATDYEVARLRGLVSTAEEFVRERSLRSSGAR